MLGPSILAASLVPRAHNFKHGNRWQYHSRSDHHSRVACWVLMFDLLRHCALLRQHAASGRVGYGLNHEMRDPRTSRIKTLDLVLGGHRAAGGAPTLGDQALEIGVVMDARAQAELASLPRLDETPIGAVHVALEAKACMTGHGKARSRLYDEFLNSSQLANRGRANSTIAAGLAIVNVAPSFISPGRNDFDLSKQPPTVSRHVQPRDAASVVSKLRELPRRSSVGAEGYDAFAIVLVACRNDGTPVSLCTDPPAPLPSDVDCYARAVNRMAELYEQRYNSL